MAAKKKSKKRASPPQRAKKGASKKAVTKAAGRKPKKAAAKKSARTVKKAAAKAPKKGAPGKSTAKKSNGSSRSRVAETILQAVTITVIADGNFASEEEALLRRLAAEPLFHEVRDVEKVIKEAVEQCIQVGLTPALEALAKRLPSKLERETAFATCLAAAAADGKITSTEARLLQELKGAFQISDARVRDLAGPIAEIFG